MYIMLIINQFLSRVNNVKTFQRPRVTRFELGADNRIDCIIKVRIAFEAQFKHVLSTATAACVPAGNN